MVKHARVCKWSYYGILCGLVVCASTVAASDKAKVHLIASGGTLARTSSGWLSAAELRELDSELNLIAEVSVEDYVTIGSSRMTPDLQFGLAKRVNELFRDEPDLAGIVVTHGTDSLEESAFFVDLLVRDERPVVFTGAMRPLTRTDTDAPRNLVNAVRLAASQGATGLGVVVTLNDEIHAARDVRKTHTIATAAFASPGLGLLGYVDEDGIYLARKPARRLTLDVETVEPRVTVIRLFAGSDGSQVSAAVASGQRGIVLEVFGRGNVPPKVLDAVRDARTHDIVVVFTSRTGGGRVVVGDDAKRLGVLSGEDLDGLKARIVLVAALGTTRDPDDLRSYFRRLSGKLDE